MDISQINEIINTLMKHRTELLKAARIGRMGKIVMAEVDNNGEWNGLQLVEAGTVSELENKGHGHALFIECNPLATRASISDAIFEWEEKQFEKLRGVDKDIERDDTPFRDNYRDYPDDDFPSRGR